ncbi:protein lifeguard 2-like isoform X1 [Callorhinus ursinus]|uniref:Protein lifeguard 2-like isoform X1 n=2 Tax=Callorhinus ursinus TaxID=34884 RepID=A0A3Q7P3U2_CALUR|nr:protein lifeguard 2-like isoform X1 [Callorhinus ursinus]
MPLLAALLRGHLTSLTQQPESGFPGSSLACRPGTAREETNLGTRHLAGLLSCVSGQFPSGELQILPKREIFPFLFKMKMDLEISEPIDFSSGDHHHLVRKAADSNVQIKSGQSYTTSPSEPQKTRGNPHSKMKERADSYVVQISDETTPNDSNNLANPFSDSSVRKAFIIKVFLILSAQLVATGAIVSLFLFWKSLKSWVLTNAWFTYAILPAFFVVLIVLACCGKLRRQVPANYILLGLFTVLQGLLLGAVSVFYNAEEVLWATAATAVVTLALTLFALQTKWDFTMLNGMLFVLLFVLIIYGILLLFIRSYWLHLLYAGLGTIIFSLYLVMDVQLMVGGRHHHSDLDPEEYVFAALNIYLDIINLFLFILQLIGLGRLS